MKQKSKKVGELLFGIHPIIELIKAKKRSLLMIYTTRPEPKAWNLIAPLLEKKPVVPIQYVPRDVLTRMAGTIDHQGIVAYAKPFVTRKKFFDSKTHPLLVMLDGVQDVHNVGAILRSAYCTGFDGVIISQKNSASLTPTVLKASAGLAEHLDIYIAQSGQAAIAELRNAGYTPYLTFLNGTDATTQVYQSPLCIIIGNEATGISRDIIGAGPHITIPQRTSAISYNASVAAGIILFLVAHRIGRLGISV